MVNPKKTFEGIMDCYGVESFKEFGVARVPFKMRADANRQRHAIYYIVDLTSKEEKDIRDLIAKDKYIDACKKIKLNDSLRVPESHIRSVHLIPNPELDPWGRG